MYARASAVVIVVVVLLLAAGAGPASATPADKLYASMSTTLDAAGTVQGHVEGYALDAATFAASTDTIEVKVARAGADQTSATGAGYARIASFALAAGDEVTVTDVDTSDAHTVTYTGQPTLDVSALCAAGAKFSGTRDDGKDVSVSATSASGAVGAVKVATGAGTTFAGGFTTTLTSAWTVRAQETVLATPAFSAYADVSRTALDCPPPVVADPTATPTPTPVPVVTTAAPDPAPAPPSASAPPKDVIAPLASLTVRVTRAWRALVGGTFSDKVTLTEPGTVKQVLYLDTGAHAAKATVLGSGRAVVAKAGKVTVKVKLSKKGKAHVRARKAVKVKLVTTVVDRAGNARVLAPKRFTVKRGK
jgi:hypothetical protein